MKGLTLTQPWATLMVLDEKRVETRGWSTDYRGRLAIHAAKGLADPICNEDGLRLKMAELPFSTALLRHGYSVSDQLPRGAVLGYVDLVACLPTNELARRMAELPELEHWEPAQFERAFGNYEHGRFAWLTRDLVVFPEPIPYRGAQGLFEIPDGALAAVA